jgi:hypothetical protein
VVFDEVHPARAQVRKQFLEGGRLKQRRVPAVVHHDVELRYFRSKGSPEIAVALVSNEYPGRLVGVAEACFLEVDAVHPGARSEVLMPHVETSAAADADLEHMDLGASEGLEMPVVDVEIVVNLPDTAAFLMLVEERS